MIIMRCIILVIAISLPGMLYPAVIHVPADQPTIQAGIDAAVDGDTVLVADGTYTGPGNRDIDFSGKAITVKSANGAENCVIDCQGSAEELHRGFVFQSNEGYSSVVEGFTIQGGAVAHSGGGIRCSLSSPTIRDNIISGNVAYSFGGGIYCENSAATIRGNTISGNSTLIFFGGGGIFISGSAPVIESNVISGNTADIGGGFGHGGGIACNDTSTLISGNTISGNTAAQGGGIYCHGWPYPTITGNMISGNISSEGYEGGGGGIYFDEFTAPVFSNNVVTGNMSNYGGGGIRCMNNSTPWIINNLITDNHTDSSGGGMYIRYATPVMKSNTFSGNSAVIGGGGIYETGSDTPIATSSIVWGNMPDQIDGTITFLYSDIEGGWSGTGNVDADPLFVSGPLGDFYLSQVAAGQAEDSPCMDTGHPGDDVIWGTTRTDQFRDTGVVDMGFHFSWQSVSGQLACIPSSGTLPFQATFGIQLSNNLINSERTIAAQIDVALAGGLEFPSWKSGTVTIGPDDFIVTAFNSIIPMLPQVVGENTFTLIAEDVTPAPCNQPPYPPSGDVASSDCTVEGIAP